MGPSLIKVIGGQFMSDSCASGILHYPKDAVEWVLSLCLRIMGIIHFHISQDHLSQSYYQIIIRVNLRQLLRLLKM